MHRFYCPDLPIPASPPSDLSDGAPAAAAVARLDKDEAHHARRVLRLEIGEEIELFDGRGATARGVIEDWSGGASVRLAKLWHTPPPRPRLDLAVAVPKGPRADDMMNALSQLGVDRVIPLRTRRGVVDPRPQKLERFSRAAIESAKQSGRAHLMEVAEPATVEEVLSAPYDVRLLAAPGGDARDALARVADADSVLVLIGPEGGWAPEELAAADRAGALRWSLGPHVMRIETAAQAAAAIVRHGM